jgi:hypothetical protein
MPITVQERHQSRKAGDDWREFAYIVTGTDSEVEALNAVPGAQYISIPHPEGSLYLPLVLARSVTVEQQIDGPNKDLHTWYATVRYETQSSGNNENNNTGGDLNYSISVTAHTANVKVAIEQPAPKLASGESDPKFGNYIGVVGPPGNQTIQGVDCIFPQATLEIERKYSRSAWNNRVKSIIGRVGTVNAGGFEGFGEEEVLFAGARVSRGRSEVAASYQFLISLTENVDIPGIGGVSKKGWRYIWVYSRPADDGIGTKAIAAYVSRVYRRVSFAGII